MIFYVSYLETDERPRTEVAGSSTELDQRREMPQSNRSGRRDIWLKSFQRLVKKTLREFSADNGSLLSAALAYYGLISLVPLLMLGVSVAGFVLGSSEAATDRVLEFVATIMPTATAEVESLMDSLIKSRGIASGIGLLGLMWSGSQMFLVLEQAMNIAWDCPPRGWLRSRMLALGMVAAMGFFGTLSLGTTLTVSVIQGYQLTIFGLRPARFVLPVIGFLVPSLITVAMFTALYRFTPNCNVSPQSARAGGLLAGLLFEAAKVGFAFYIANFGNFDKVYGSIAGVISLALWSFYGANVALLGAEFASEYDRIMLDTQSRRHGPQTKNENETGIHEEV